MKSLTNLFILFFVLIVLGFLYKRFEDKRLRDEEGETHEAIKNYLLDDVTLGKSKKPILWIHVPHEYNSRNWLSFGSRNSFDLNQPYLYLTVRSIIKQCEDSFTICIIDDSSFQRLISNWNIDMTCIAEPILSNVRMLGLSKLLYTYGGLICPISFICLKNLIGLYDKGTNGNKMFVCEMVDRNITSTDYNFFPSLFFWGAPRECETVRELCNVIQRVVSHDFTADVRFLGEFNKWCKMKINNGNINLIDSLEIGVKTNEGKQIIIDNLLSNYYLHISQNAYGIYIPANEILKRRKYEWFSRMSPKQVLESDTAIGNYLLLVTAPGNNKILEPLNNKVNKSITDKFVGFWKTPLYPGLWMVDQPNMLGDNIPRVSYTGR
jgi:hypothetical protein